MTGVKQTFNHMVLVILSMLVVSINVYAADEEVKVEPVPEANAYTAQPGDVLQVNVWKEEGLQQDVLVRPDGGISFPLVGDFKAKGLSLEQIQEVISERLTKYISDPVVSVSAGQLMGHKIFVIGKVNKPDQFHVNRYVDVMQALSLAGGMTPFASVNNILILRRDDKGEEKAIKFRYGDVEDGDDLEQNIILQSGDVVVVP
jgi:polysaccharide export outer membrane protein